MVLQPPVGPIDRDGLVFGQVLDVELRIGPLGDAVFGLAPGVVRVVDVAALIPQDELDG